MRTFGLILMTFFVLGCANKNPQTTVEVDGKVYRAEFKGYCAYNLADDDLVEADGNIWYIHNDKLYLFEDESVKEEWFDQIDNMIELGTKYWEAYQSALVEDTNASE